MNKLDQMTFEFSDDIKQKFLFFDTETTDIEDKGLIQLAIVIDGVEEINMFFKPKEKISFKAMSIHNITPEMLEDKPAFEDAEYKGEKIKDYLNKLAQEYIWVAHNVDFDLAVLKKVGVEIPNTICTFKMARELLSLDQKDIYDLESYSLQFLRYYLGLYKKENHKLCVAHDALSDVFFLKDLFDYIISNFDLTVEKMIHISKAPLIIRNLHYGKHAGKSIKEIQQEDPGYLQWIMDTWTDKPDVVWNIKRVLEKL